MPDEEKEKKLTKEERAQQADDKAQKDIMAFYKTKEMAEITAKLEKLIVKPIENPREKFSSKNLPKLKTGTLLDDILGHGGISAEKLIEVYGEYGTGKTQVCFSLAAEAAQEGTVAYIDAEYTFSSDRLEEICKSRNLDVEKFWNNLLIYQPETWLHQLGSIQQIPSPSDLAKDSRPPLKLIIVDSLLTLIDSSEDFEGRQNLPVRSRVIRTQILGKLRQMARLHKCVVFFTNQVQDVPEVKPFTPWYLRQKGKGGPTVSHVPDIILMFRKSAGNTRIARLMDSSELPVGERVYCINEKGIDDVPEDIKSKVSKTTAKQESAELENAEKEANAVLGEEHGTEEE